MAHFVYVLTSLSDAYRYVGITTDPTRRLREHNAGRTRSTAQHRPYHMTILKRTADRSSARRAEKYYKTGFGRKAVARMLARASSDSQIVDLSGS